MSLHQTRNICTELLAPNFYPLPLQTLQAMSWTVAVWDNTRGPSTDNPGRESFIEAGAVGMVACVVFMRDSLFTSAPPVTWCR